jgi:hypothetical protein
VTDSGDEVCLGDPAIVVQGGGFEAAKLARGKPFLPQVLGEGDCARPGVDRVTIVDVAHHLGDGTLRVAPGAVRADTALPSPARGWVEADVDPCPPTLGRLVDVTGHGVSRRGGVETEQRSKFDARHTKSSP